jgi:hypothetical protein
MLSINFIGVLLQIIMAHGFTVYLEQYQSISIQLAPIRDEE